MRALTCILSTASDVSPPPVQSTPSRLHPLQQFCSPYLCQAQAARASLLAGVPTAIVEAASAHTEGGQVPEAYHDAARSSLEALRLANPDAMSGCWNLGCAAVLAQAAYQRALGDCALV